jgi:integrase/recombinase XerD
MKKSSKTNLLPATRPGTAPAAGLVDFLAAVPAPQVWLTNFTSERTRATYLKAVEEFASFLDVRSTEDLARITQAHVIAFREHLSKLGAAPATIYNRLSAVSSLYKHLCEQGAARINPTTGVRRPKVHQGRVRTPVITPAQVRAMLEAPDVSKPAGRRDSAVLHVLFYTGCRISEVTTLKVRDFYQDGGYWVLDFVVKGGKRNKIAIHQELRLALDQYLSAAGHRENREAPLLQAVQARFQKGEPLTRKRVHDIFHRYARKAGMPEGVRPHTARATFITQALENKCPIEAVQRSVGHSKISTTQMYDKREVHHRESASFVVQY